MGAGGGGNISDYISRLISCSLHLLGGLAGASPPRKFCALRQLLVQSEAKICLTVVSSI